MSDFEFVAELPERVGGGRGASPLLQEFADALREARGTWAVWPTPVKYGAAVVASIRAGKKQTFPLGQFEAASRQGVCYVRFVGDET